MLCFITEYIVGFKYKFFTHKNRMFMYVLKTHLMLSVKVAHGDVHVEIILCVTLLLP